MVKVTEPMNKKMPNNPQSGIAAIFTVVFFTILISIIILSFVHIVSQDQRQVTNNDLSNSAYDSAEAGTEDAKRALEKYRQECIKTALPGANCGSGGLYANALSGSSCSSFNQLESLLHLNLQGSEVKVATNSQDDSLEQAYTCLKIELQTDDYVRTQDANQTILVPLKTVNNEEFPYIELNWFNKNDSPSRSVPSDTSNFELPEAKDWPNTRPPILQAQIIAVNRNAPNITDIDNSAKSVFLYPSSAAPSSNIDVSGADAARRSQKYSPVAAQCVTTDAQYSCSVRLENFEPLSGGPYDYYLRLMPAYNSATVQVRLLSADPTADPIKFDGVEPVVDSTGRANNVYRRIVSRIAFEDELTSLNGGAGFDITQGLCKQFEIADLPTYYVPHCSDSNLVQE